MIALLSLKNILEKNVYWGHIKPDVSPELLQEHLQLTLAYYELFCEKKRLEQIILNLIGLCGCDEMEKKMVYQFFVQAIYWHDIGKINPRYQEEILKNPHHHCKSKKGSKDHSLYSAYIYTCELLPIVKQHKSKRKLSCFLLSFAFCISRHHGYLKDLSDFDDRLTELNDQDYLKTFYETEGFIKGNWFIDAERLALNILHDRAFYMLNKLLFALITACDYCATGEYMNGGQMALSTLDNPEDYLAKYQAGKIYQEIKAYEQAGNGCHMDAINGLRSEMFLETEANLLNHLDGHIFYLEAPTGAGKTNMSINLFLQTLTKQDAVNNVFYIFPFNTLVEQTAQTLSLYFEPEKDFVIVNSLTPYVLKEKEKEEFDYEYTYLNHAFNNYPIVVTSHINFFNALFGCSREQNFPLIKLCNSVVILDEIQAYRNKIWHQIIYFLDSYAKYLNIKVIIMSATLPRLDCLLGETLKSDIVTLLPNTNKYYQNTLFRDRVKIDCSLLQEKKLDWNQLVEKVLLYAGRKILIEFITKESARRFYHFLQTKNNEEELNLEIEELSGDDNTLLRKKVIAKTKQDKPLILIATQVIEAGVDIDMEIGFKEVSIPDAEEQFMGRINRSCKNSDSVVYFFNGTNPKLIYRDDVRADYSVNNKTILSLIVKKDFKTIYQYIIEDIQSRSNELNANNIQNITNACFQLRYKEVERVMRLIDSTIQIYLPYCYEYEEAGICQHIDGAEIWDQFKHLSSDRKKNYAQKKVELSYLRKNMEPFIFTLSKREEKDLSKDNFFGGFYCIVDGEEYVENGKFSREKFKDYFKIFL